MQVLESTITYYCTVLVTWQEHRRYRGSTKMAAKKKHLQNRHKRSEPSLPARPKSHPDEALSDVEVSFEAFNMSELDFHSVKQYLASLFGSSHHKIDLSGLAAFITEDAADFVGTALKQGEEGESGDAYAMIALVPLGSKARKWSDGKWEGVLAGLESFLVRTLSRELEGGDEPFEGAALLIHERLMNMPASVAGPMYRQLLEDWAEAVKEEASLWGVSRFILITPTYELVESELQEEDSGDAASEKDERKPAKRTKTSTPLDSSTKQPSIEYYYPEAESLDRLDSLGVDCHFQVASPHTTTDSRRVFGDKGAKPKRRAVILDAAQLERYVELISEASPEA